MNSCYPATSVDWHAVAEDSYEPVISCYPATSVDWQSVAEDPYFEYPTTEDWTTAVNRRARGLVRYASSVLRAGRRDGYETATWSREVATRRAGIPWYGTTTTWGYCGTCTAYEYSAPSRREQLAEIIRRRTFPAIRTGRTCVRPPEDLREHRARETLRRVLGEASYRGFLRNGFVSVRGRSGSVYVIYPGSAQTKVYRDGRLVERLCVVLPGSFPPTDSLITRYLMILNDEGNFRRLAVRSSVPRTVTVVASPAESLVAIARGIRVA